MDALYEIDFDSAHELSPLGRSANVFGDGSFWAYHAPGHRKWHVSYFVNGKKRTVLITGDVCDIKVGFDHCVSPEFGSHDIPETQRTLERIVEFVGKYPQVNVFSGHEVD